MKAASTGAWRRWRSILKPWGHLGRLTSRIRRHDLKTRLARCWTRRCRYSASSSVIPPRDILEECRAKGIVTIGTATTPEEAAALKEAGIDAIVASGFEAGGHRGSFLGPAEDSLTGTLSLVPQIRDIIDVPVIAAGGIADARGVIAALALGAEAVQRGTAFLACDESGAGRLHREALRGRAAGHTALTKGFTGRLARGIHNRLLEELNRPGTEILPYPLQRGLVRSLSVAAEAAGRSDLLPLWAGQSASLSTGTDVVAFLDSLVKDVAAIAGPVMQWSARTSHHLRCMHT